MQENVDYELIPVENEEHWQIRIKTGEYIETVFEFGKLKIVDEEYMNFSYDLIYTPIEDLNEENTDFQYVVKEILMSVMESAMSTAPKKENV
jgi:hypothetical protein|tara:strand:+ start:28 stop:303 length:276 start_codon:yes stop_codon:yes gene_type:complete